MSGGGGSTYYPQQQDNSLALAQLQYQQQAATQAAADAKAAKLHTDFTTNLSNAATGAQGTGRDILASRGLNYDEFGNIVNRAITDEQSRVPVDDPNPSQYFTSDLINNALTTEENARRARNTSTVNQTFTPGFENTALPDDIGGSYINDILTSQRGSAESRLKAARDRGQLNDSGYSAAEAELNRQSGGASSTLSGLASSVLAKDRADLGNIRGSAITGANQYSLGDPNFDINPFVTQKTNKVNTDTANLGGDITNALGGTSLFNVNDILLKGSTAQGPQNLTTAGVPGVPVKKSQIDRGLGSTGAF